MEVLNQKFHKIKTVVGGTEIIYNKNDGQKEYYGFP
jgi:hypothetical protein